MEEHAFTLKTREATLTSEVADLLKQNNELFEEGKKV